MVLFLALMQGVPTPDLPDDPGVARLLQREVVFAPSERPVEPDRSGPFRIGLAFGYSSALVDPDLQEGFGGSADFAYGRRWTIELRSSAAYQRYVDPLDNLGVQFISGDLTVGPGYKLLERSGVRVRAFAGAGPAWMTTWLGVNWSLGILGGLGVEWEITPWFGLRLEARYHLFHLTEIGGAEFYDRRSLRNVGPVDRLDLPLGLVFRL